MKNDLIFADFIKKLITFFPINLYQKPGIYYWKNEKYPFSQNGDITFLYTFSFRELFLHGIIKNETKET